MQVEHKNLRFEIKSDPGETGVFEGLGGCFNNIDGVGDIIAPGAFKDSIANFLAQGFIGGVNHDWDHSVGHPIDAKEVAEGLWIKAALDDHPEAQAVRSMMKVNPASGRATIQKLSIGYGVPKGSAVQLKGAGEVRAYWKSVGYDPTPEDEAEAAAYPKVRLLKKVHLFEVSPVLVPANQRATISGAKFLGGRPVPGLPLGEHSRDVVSAIGDYLSRVDSRSRARAKAGRELSGSNRTEIESACAALESGVSRLRSILDRTQPAAKSDATTPIEAEAGGAAEVPVEAKADPALLTRIMDTRRAILMDTLARS